MVLLRIVMNLMLLIHRRKFALTVISIYRKLKEDSARIYEGLNVTNSFKMASFVA